MAMEITQILTGSSYSNRSEDPALHSATTRRRVVREQQADQQQQRQLTREEIQRYTSELQQVSQAMNKRLSFSYNEDLQLMVVKVIDRNTDKVIKELPPTELQRVHMRIREAIGLLLDESA
ncbi:MAG TPA: flagellar protein FlaG [Alkalispirochaeta sp.]|nr:flagellar protein FlaG [Alkalispirochaeta sp.]